jgi:hypothetical protein
MKWTKQILCTGNWIRRFLERGNKKGSGCNPSEEAVRPPDDFFAYQLWWLLLTRNENGGVG